MATKNFAGRKRLMIGKLWNRSQNALVAEVFDERHGTQIYGFVNACPFFFPCHQTPSDETPTHMNSLQSDKEPFQA